MAIAPRGNSPMVTYLCGERDAQQEASHSHSQRYEGLFADDPLIAHLIHNGRDQSLQQAELHRRRGGGGGMSPPWPHHATPSEHAGPTMTYLCTQPQEDKHKEEENGPQW